MARDISSRKETKEERKAHFLQDQTDKGEMVADARVQLHCYSGSLELARSLGDILWVDRLHLKYEKNCEVLEEYRFSL